MKTKKTYHFSEEEEEKIMLKHRAGVNYKIIAKELGLTPKQVQNKIQYVKYFKNQLRITQ